MKSVPPLLAGIKINTDDELKFMNLTSQLVVTVYSNPVVGHIWKAIGLLADGNLYGVMHGNTVGVPDTVLSLLPTLSYIPSYLVPTSTVYIYTSGGNDYGLFKKEFKILT